MIELLVLLLLVVGPMVLIFRALPESMRDETVCFWTHQKWHDYYGRCIKPGCPTVTPPRP